MNSHQRIFLFSTIFYLCMACSCRVFSQTGSQSGQKSFTVVPLGVRGGLDESNLSAYMVAPAGSEDFICLDAGTLYAGLRQAVAAGTFHGDVSELLRQRIKAYFISHPHLDHVAGLIMNSPDDTAKTIYAMPYCLAVLEDKYFSWQSWANFGDAGEKPQLKKYHYEAMEAGVEKPVTHTALSVTAWPLSHGEPYQSTAFLVRKGEDRLLYLGDTGADTIEHAGKLYRLWQEVAPLVKQGRLKAIFIEVSFPDEQPAKLLFGHLTPHLLMDELKVLERLAGKDELRGMNVVVTHEKPSGDQESRIRRELEAQNSLQLRLVFPQQGVRMDF